MSLVKEHVASGHQQVSKVGVQQVQLRENPPARDSDNLGPCRS